MTPSTQTQSPAQPSPVTNPLHQFYLRNESFLLKGAPLFIGFMMFFLYFTQNSFFPAIDLFGLASLMLSAFLIGSAFCLIAGLGLWYPGAFWVSSTLGDQVIRRKLWRNKPGKRSDSDHSLLLIMTHLFLPFLATGLINAGIATAVGNLWLCLGLVASATIAVSGIASYLLARRFSLQRTELYEQLFVLCAAQVFSLVLYIVVALLLSREFNALHTSRLSYEAIWLAPILTTAAITVSALSSQVMWQYSIAIRFVLVILLALPTGLVKDLPPQVMRWLGAGNYKAHEVLLAPDECKALSAQYPSISGCVLHDVKVVWGLGDTLKMRLALADYQENQISCNRCADENKCTQALILSKSAVSSMVLD